VDSSTGALFDYDFSHARPGTDRSYSQTYADVLRFTVGPQDTTYAVSGKYTATDVGAPGRVYLESYLRHVDAATLLFRDVSGSNATTNESFTLGVANDGDVALENINTGSLTGTLLAGQTYEFHFNSFIFAFPEGDSGTSAEGCVTLSIGGATGGGACGVQTSVPDLGVSTGSLLTLALGAMVCARRWRVPTLFPVRNKTAR
jgi:hypothetical protein